MLIQTGPLSFPARALTGGNPTGIPSGLVGELMVSEVLAKYSTLAKAGKLFSAYATLTAPVAFGTAAALGGPLLWNRPGSNIDAHILAIGVAGVVASAAAGALGLTGGSGQSVAPSSTTAIDASGNCLIGGQSSSVSAFRLGTVTNAATIFHPVFTVGTTALTAQFTSTWVDIGGAFVIPPGAYGAVAGSVVLTTAQLSVGLIWAELPS